MSGKRRLTTVFHLLIALGIAILVTGGEIRQVPGLPLVNLSSPGDINIGVIISVHNYNDSVLCGPAMREMGALQRLESILFAIEEINQNRQILGGVRLGYTVVDDCTNSLAAMTRALHFVQEDGPEGGSFPAIDAVAVLGAEASPRTIQIADILSVFNIPQLSYASSSALLDDKSKYRFFSRTVPSDTLQAMAIVNILTHFGWSYVSLLYSEGSYGSEGYRAIKAGMEAAGFCLAVVHELSDDFGDEKYAMVVDNLLEKPMAKVVVLFTTMAQARQLFKALQRRNATDNFTWVGGDSINMNAHSFDETKDVAEGTLSVNFISEPVDRFEEHFKHLTLRNGSRNPWFREFYASFFSCDPYVTPGSLGACNRDLPILNATGYQAERTASLAMNGVYALAHALHMLTANCSETVKRRCVTAENLVSTIRRVKFMGEGANITFDEKGNGQSTYDIRSLYVGDDGMPGLRTVGKWDPSTHSFVYFNDTMLTWKQGLLDTYKNQISRHPVSVCSRPCAAGQQAVRTQPSCCWYCEPCRDNERTIVRAGLPKCERCPTPNSFTWPDTHNRTECLPIPVSVMNVLELEGGLLLAMDFLVLGLTCFVGVDYIKHRDSRLIKASSRELSIMMLIGHVVTCLLVCAFIFEPNGLRCIVSSLGFHVSFTVSYGPLLVKTNRIYRIFMSGKSTTKKPLFVGSRAQVVISACLIATQCLLMSIWMFIETPSVVTQMPSLSEKYVEKVCSVPQAGFLISLIFNLIVVVICAGHAFKTRKLPANFNEAKFITFTIYTTMLLWLSFFPTYFTSSRYNIKVLCLAIAMLFNVLSFQVFLFLPKLYAVRFVEEAELHVRDTRTVTQPSNHSSADES